MGQLPRPLENQLLIVTVIHKSVIHLDTLFLTGCGFPPGWLQCPGGHGQRQVRDGRGVRRHPPGGAQARRDARRRRRQEPLRQRDPSSGDPGHVVMSGRRPAVAVHQRQLRAGKQ